MPVKFSLGGYQGLDGLMAPARPRPGWSPARRTRRWTTSSDRNPGASTLTYDAASDTYSYVWKTDKSWTGTCRQLRCDPQ